MKICIKTAGRTAMKLYEKIKDVEGVDIVFFTDNDVHKWGKVFVEDIPVVSVFTAYEKYANGEIEKIILGTEMPVKSCRAMYKELIEVGFEREDILFISKDWLRGDSSELEYIHYEEYNYLQYLEFHLTNRCNLNCAGCSHFIPIIPKDDEIDFRELKKDLKKLKEKVFHIDNIRIMGGEPLMSNDLEECCKWVRTLWPYSDIRVATNGILLLNREKSFFETLMEYNIALDITCYPPIYNHYEKIAKYLEIYGVKYQMDIRWGMCPVLHRDAEHCFRHDCTALTCECYNLYRGKLYPCPVAAYISYFNQYFGENFPENEGTDIYKIDTFWELYSELILNKKICDYCEHYAITKNYNRRKFKISSKVPKVEDWIKEYRNK